MVSIRSEGVLSEWRLYVRLVIPLIVSSLAQIVLGLFDTAFVGRLGANGLAAVSAATSLYNIITQVLAASAVGYQIRAARLFGGNKADEVGAHFANALVLPTVVAAVGVVVLLNGTPLIELIVTDETVVRGAMFYLLLRSPSLVLLAFLVVVQATLNTAKRTNWTMYSGFLTMIVDIPLSFLFIFGFSPFPSLGVAGSGLANTVATFAGLVFLLLVLVRRPLFHLSRPTWNRGLVGSLARLSAPEMMNAFLDYTGNFLFAIIIGTLGVVSLAGARVSYAILIFLFSIALNFAFGTQILMGHKLGEGDIEGARRTLVSDLTLTTIIFGVVGAVVVILPSWIGRIFTNSSMVVNASIGATIVTGVSCPLMVLATGYAGALRALAKTKLVMYTNLAAVWFVQIPVGWALGIPAGQGIAGLYMGFFAYFASRIVLGRHLAERSLRKESGNG